MKALFFTIVMFSTSAFGIHTHSVYENSEGVTVCVEDPSFGGEYLESDGERFDLLSIRNLVEYETEDQSHHVVLGFRGATVTVDGHSFVVPWSHSLPGSCW